MIIWIYICILSMYTSKPRICILHVTQSTSQVIVSKCPGWVHAYGKVQGSRGGVSYRLHVGQKHGWYIYNMSVCSLVCTASLHCICANVGFQSIGWLVGWSIWFKLGSNTVQFAAQSPFAEELSCCGFLQHVPINARWQRFDVEKEDM